MFNLNDDDDFVPTTASTSNLANLFGNNTHSTTASSASNPLFYTAPKQPKTQIVSKAPSKKLICMKIVQLHRFDDNAYTLLGKFGAAIISDTNNESPELILYKTKQNIISSTKLNNQWQYRCSSDIVITFRDDQKEYWSLTFDSCKEFMEFVSELNKLGAINSSDETATTVTLKSQQMIAEKPEEEDIRADILGRISKVGQSILPANNSKDSITSVSESETEEVSKKQSTKKPNTKKSVLKNRYQLDRTDSEVESDALDLVQNFPASGQFAHNMFMHMSSMHPHQLMDPLNVHFAENRTHNSEVRMNLSQLMNKVDNLVRDLQPKPQNDQNDLNERLLQLERALKIQNSHESEDKKSRNEENCKKYEDIIGKQNEKIKELEESLKNVLEEKNEKFSDSIKNLEEQVEKHKKDLENSEEKYKELRENTRKDNQSIEELENRLQKINGELEDSKFENENLQRELTALKVENEGLIQELNRKEHDLQMNNETSLRDFSEGVKECMNKMYQNVLSKCETSKEVKRALQQNMKSATYDIIQLFSSIAQGETSSPSTPVPEFEVTV